MANGFYTKGKEGLIDGTIDVDTHTIKIALLKDAYVFSAEHDNRDDLGTNVVAITAAVPNPTKTDGVFDHDTATATGVPGPDNITKAAYFKDTGNTATDRLLCFFDTFASGTPLTPNGGNVNYTPHASGVFAL